MIETQIDEKLWRSVKKNYEGRSFSESIIDAIYYLSNLIRDKTGLESDGVALVGQAFGGSKPLIKVNSLQTESEISVQRGVEQILRGLYQAIRNPRSHDRYEDPQKDADAIITFIDYVTRIIDRSKTKFSESEFLNRVFDVNYVTNERYSDLLVEEIPKRKRLNFAIEVYKKKETGDGEKLSFFFKSIFKQFSEEELNSFYEVVTDELSKVSEGNVIRYNLQVLPFENWMNIKELARIRIENMILQSIENGKYMVEMDRCNGGSLGTWAAWGNVKYMTFVEDFLGIFIRKLESEDKFESDYILTYYWDDLLSNLTHPNQHFNRVIKQKLKEGDKRFYDKLLPHFVHGKDDDIIIQTFKEDYENFEERQNTIIDISDDDLPF